MSQSSKKVLHYLAGDENIESVDIEVLEKLVAENPYFPITQFLLSKKLKGVNEDLYLQEVQKTALYFSNPLWLNYQLAEEVFEGDTADQEISSTPSENFDNGIPQESSNYKQQENISKLPAIEVDNQLSTINDEIEIRKEEGTIGKVEETTQIAENKIVEDTQDIDSDNTVEVEEESSNTITEDVGKKLSDADSIVVPVGTEGLSNEDLITIPSSADVEVTGLKEEMAGVTNTIDQTTEQFLKEAEDEYQKEELTPEDEHDKMFQNIKAMLDASSEEASADIKDAVIPIDPYYTIDYFASQGIKLELDVNPQDQLGQHLKKFTQWLKHMKKLGPEDATEVISRTETDEDIQQIADSSNTVREVVTEAMASVLEKQGKKDKAIELYNKLSFLNPDKRTYFADKINKLKGT